MKLVGLGAASLALPGCLLDSANERPHGSRSRPDIVLIMADDMGYSDIGCYGGEIRTPNLDSLASRGVRFTQFYNTARCCPTRASLLTGLYPHQAGVGHMMGDQKLPGYQGDINRECVTIAEALRAAGYATYISGKWHVTRQLGFWTGNKSLASQHNWPLQRGFDRFFGTIHGGGSYFDPVSLSRDNTPIDTPEGSFYYTDAVSDNAVRFIEDHAEEKSDRPFFCYVAYTSPHWPLHALAEDIERYTGRFDAGWDTLRKERLERMRTMGLIDPRWKLTERDSRVAPWEEVEDKAWQARRMEVYAAQVDRMDQGIGSVIAALERTGRLENTLIFFLADNGGCAEEIAKTWKGIHIPRQQRNGQPVLVGNEDHMVMPGPEGTYQSYGIPWANVSNTPFRRYKHWVHEGGIASPLIVSWPARIAGGGDLRHHVGHLIDIMPSCIDAAGADYPAELAGQAILPMEGRSLLPACDNVPWERGPIFFEHEGNRAVRHGRWKLVARGARGAWELYDMEKDRTETENLAAAHPDRVEAMAASWQAWAERARVLPWPWKKKM